MKVKLERIGWLLIALIGWLGVSVPGDGAEPKELVRRATGAGIILGYKDTPLLPWTGNKYHMHDPDRPAPRVMSPAEGAGLKAPPPSDAVVLFDGKNLDAWNKTTWKLVDGSAEAGNDDLVTKRSFGDMQLHLEWMTPTRQDENFMSRGNSGVLLMGRYEIQVFDSWHEHDLQIYPDGQAASIYGQTPPRVNACRAPGQWQAYDLVFRTPRFKGGLVAERGRVTLFHNGVLALWNCEIMGPMSHRVILPYKVHDSTGPLVLQGHHSPVRYRNIWVRPLDDRQQKSEP